MDVDRYRWLWMIMQSKRSVPLMWILRCQTAVLVMFVVLPRIGKFVGTRDNHHRHAATAAVRR